MTSDEILVIANDVIPGQGIPVAAPGLRAWGIADGLRAHGHRALLVVDGEVADRAWDRPLPPISPRGSMVVSPDRFGDLVRTRRPRAVVVTNSNHVERLGDLDGVSLIFDFFAPKILELEQHPQSAQRDRGLARLRERKIDALAKSSAVIINGAKKRDYVQHWLELAGNEAAMQRTAVVPMPLTPGVTDPVDDGRVHAVVAGYIQPWSQPGEWADAVWPYLDDGSLVLHLLVATHWGGRSRADLDVVPENFRRLAAHPGVVSHGPLEYGEFRRMLARCHLSIDLFERNPERELAMVTRTAVSLSCGLPVVHVPFTETAEFVRAEDAGWLVEGEDTGGIAEAVGEAVSDPAALARKRAGAERVATQILEPAAATRPLHDLLGELP